MSELRALLTPAGLELLDALGPVTSTAEAAAAVSRLRAAGHSPDLVSAVVGQAHLRAKATAKFGPFAARMLFTRAGLEQATRLGVAARHAQRIRRAGLTSVADLGCGIGGDALAFAGAGLAVHAVDADEVTAAFAAYNLAPFGEDATVRHATAEEALGEPVPGQAIWMDPARRTSGHSETRRVSADDYSPLLDWAFAVAAQRPTGIKLGPAHDRDALPSGSAPTGAWSSSWCGRASSRGKGCGAPLSSSAASARTSSPDPRMPRTRRSVRSGPSSTSRTGPSSGPGSSATSPAASTRGCSIRASRT